MKNFAIIGNGVYGTALAHLFSKKHKVQIFGRIPNNVNELPITSFGKTEVNYDYLIISITTKPLAQVFEEIYSRINPDTHIILAMKGLTEEGELPIDACRKIATNHRISVLSGPGFASEIVADIPVHLVLAGTSFDEDEEEDFLLDGLTLDFSYDIYGVSWCGVLKNIYAIGAGIASKEYGFDRSLYTREAVHEISEILNALGFDRETAHGPAGRGDVWICTTPHSRNFRFGAGETTLANQAEGYNALIQCNLVLHSLIGRVSLPLLSKILSTFTSSSNPISI